MRPADLLEWLTFVMKHAGPLVFLFVGCVCVYALQRVPDLRSTPLFIIIRVLIIIDIVSIILSKVHDLSDDIAGAELFDPIFTTIVNIDQNIRWFSQLLALPILSGLHFLGLYAPVQFRQMRLVHGYIIVAVFMILAAALTAPLLTDCCGLMYYVDGAYWAFDWKKPGTVLCSKLNIYLQTICVAAMLVCDVFILYKVYRVRTKATTTTNTTQPSAVSGSSAATNIQIVSNAFTGSRAPLRQPRRASIERRLMISFLVLSASFIIPTVAFNMRPLYEHWSIVNLIGAVCGIIDFSKWSVYTLGTTSIRREFMRILKCKC